jgi:hypothetical protein
MQETSAGVAFEGNRMLGVEIMAEMGSFRCPPGGTMSSLRNRNPALHPGDPVQIFMWLGPSQPATGAVTILHPSFLNRAKVPSHVKALWLVEVPKSGRRRVHSAVLTNEGRSGGHGVC